MKFSDWFDEYGNKIGVLCAIISLTCFFLAWLIERFVEG